MHLRYVFFIQLSCDSHTPISLFAGEQSFPIRPHIPPDGWCQHKKTRILEISPRWQLHPSGAQRTSGMGPMSSRRSPCPWPLQIFMRLASFLSSASPHNDDPQKNDDLTKCYALHGNAQRIMIASLQFLCDHDQTPKSIPAKSKIKT